MTTKPDLLPLPEGNVAHLIAAQSAEIEALRAEVERLKPMTAVTMGVGRSDGSLFVHGDYDSIKAAQALVFRAERLADALRELVAVFSESGMYDEEVFAKARAALSMDGDPRLENKA